MEEVNTKKFCYKCGNELYAEAVICPKCGVAQPSLKKENRSKVGAALFAFFLGGFGIHKFYLGNKKWGLIYLLVGIFTLGVGTAIFWLISFVEGIIFLSMSEDAFNAKYNSAT